jgi:hypothetical protein
MVKVRIYELGIVTELSVTTGISRNALHIQLVTGIPHLALLIGSKKKHRALSATALTELHRNVSVQKLKPAT